MTSSTSLFRISHPCCLFQLFSGNFTFIFYNFLCIFCIFSVFRTQQQLEIRCERYLFLMCGIPKLPDHMLSSSELLSYCRMWYLLRTGIGAVTGILNDFPAPIVGLSCILPTSLHTLSNIERKSRTIKKILSG